jgi:hypothetical protein
LNNNIEILGGSHTGPVVRSLDKHLIGLINTHASSDLLSDLPCVGQSIWSEAYLQAKTFFLELLESNRTAIPDHIKDVLVIEPRLRHGEEEHGKTRDICISLSADVWTDTFAEIDRLVTERSSHKLTTIDRKSGNGETKYREVELEIAEQLYEYKCLHLTATALHEMIHLLQKKVYGPRDAHSLRAEQKGRLQSNDMESKSYSNAQRDDFRSYIAGNRVYIPAKGSWLGNALGELATVAAEVQLWKRAGYGINHSDKKSWSTHWPDKLMEGRDEVHLDKLKAICYETGIVSNIGLLEIPDIKLVNTGGLPVKFAYAHVFKAFIDLSREIFRTDILKSNDPYKVLFEKSLASSCAGKPVSFFKDATFEGLDDLDRTERATELRKYVRYLMRIDLYPQPVALTLLRAFVGAGVYKEGIEAVKLRREILQLDEQLNKS